MSTSPLHGFASGEELASFGTFSLTGPALKDHDYHSRGRTGTSELEFKQG